ncbi:MAG: hypothetical protein K8L91_02005 [Anaerolineae bacterium]|nr:hypothetical protein [Anaerolineae bacterium]
MTTNNTPITPTLIRSTCPIIKSVPYKPLDNHPADYSDGLMTIPARLQVDWGVNASRLTEI